MTLKCRAVILIEVHCFGVLLECDVISVRHGGHSDTRVISLLFYDTLAL